MFSMFTLIHGFVGLSEKKNLNKLPKVLSSQILRVVTLISKNMYN